MIKGYSGIFRLGEATSTWDADSPVSLLDVLLSYLVGFEIMHPKHPCKYDQIFLSSFSSPPCSWNALSPRKLHIAEIKAVMHCCLRVSVTSFPCKNGTECNVLVKEWVKHSKTIIF